MKAERPGAPDATIATEAPSPGSLQRMVRRRLKCHEIELNGRLLRHQWREVSGGLLCKICGERINDHETH